MLDPIYVGSLVLPFVAVGSTVYGINIESNLPKIKELNLRASERNTFLGNVLTHPDFNTYVIGRSYIDHKDNEAFDEDYLVYRVTLQSIEKCYGKSFEEKYQQYRGSHHSDKSYLTKQD
jgi:hypothetical protein